MKAGVERVDSSSSAAVVVNQAAAMTALGAGYNLVSNQPAITPSPLSPRDHNINLGFYNRCFKKG